MKYLLALIFFATVACTASAQTTIQAIDAAKHIGETVTVTEKVFGGKLLASNMTLIDVGGRYPNELVTIMIPAADRSKFSGQPEIDWKDRTITVTGKVIDYRGKPEIIVTDSAQVSLK